jgi:hypothetical protein
VGPFNKHVVIKRTLCPIASGTILVDRPAETALGIGDMLRDVIESIVEPNGRGLQVTEDCQMGRVGLVLINDGFRYLVEVTARCYGILRF